MTTEAADTDTAATFTRLTDRFGDVVDAVTDWSAPSPCDGWTAVDVLTHVVDTERDFLGTHGIDLGARPDLTGNPGGAWHDHAAAARTALADPEVPAKSFEGHFGPTTVGETLLRFYGFDLLVHRWDLAASQGRDLRFAEDELTTIDAAADGFGAALYSDGVCRGGVSAPVDADRQARLLARLGRTSLT